MLKIISSSSLGGLFMEHQTLSVGPLTIADFVRGVQARSGIQIVLRTEQDLLQGKDAERFELPVPMIA